MRREAITVMMLFTADASAQVAADSAKATALFERGREQLKRGETEAACGSFAESFALEPADGTELNLADCEERLGHLAAAWRLFDQTATRSATKGNKARTAAALDRAAKLLPRLGQVTLQLANTVVPALAITIAGEPVEATARIDRKVDPGPVAIHASAPGRVAFERTVTIEAGETANVTIPALGEESHEEAEPAVTPPGLPPPAVTPPVVVPPPLADTRAPMRARRHSRVLLGQIVGGVGVAGMISSGVLGLVARSEYHDPFSSGACMKIGSAIDCTPAGTRAADSAVTRANWATGIGVVGLAAAITGAVLWYTAPVEVMVTPSSASIAMVRRF
jgi:hypothetical protein